MILLNGCSDIYQNKCGKDRYCPMKEDLRLQRIEIQDAHIKICNEINLTPYTVAKFNDCNCRFTFTFIDEPNGLFMSPIDKSKVVKCWNPQEPQSVIQLSFTDVLEEI